MPTKPAQPPKPKKEDQRVRLTKQLLSQAFLELLAEKPVQAVTVKELCERAGVNRGTFYLHYNDVYHLLGELQGGLMADLDALLFQNQVITSKSSGESGAALIAALFTFFEKNRELCAILLGPNGDKQFLADIIERGRGKSIAEYREMYPGISKLQADTFYTFIAWGFIGLIQRSLQSPGAVTFRPAAAEAGQIVAQAARYFDLATRGPAQSGV